jgi:hypothetical protein
MRNACIISVVNMNVTDQLDNLGSAWKIILVCIRDTGFEVVDWFI